MPSTSTASARPHRFARRVTARLLHALDDARGRDALDGLRERRSDRLADRRRLESGRIVERELRRARQIVIAGRLHEQADVGELRDDQTADFLHRRLDVERAGQRGTRARKESESLRRPFGGDARRALLGKRQVLERATLGLLRQQVQVDEDPDLRAQDIRDDRRCNVVDGAQPVAAREVGVVVEVRGDEDDRRVRRLAPAADQLRRFEAIEAGHVDVEQDHSEVLRQHLLQRLLAGVRGDDVLPELVEDRRQREQLVGPIVDDENARAVARRHRRRGAWRFVFGHRDNHARSTPTISSASTGFDR
jgi:hypothetical protein